MKAPVIGMACAITDPALASQLYLERESIAFARCVNSIAFDCGGRALSQHPLDANDAMMVALASAMSRLGGFAH